MKPDTPSAASRLAALVRAHPDTQRQIAARAGMPPQNLYEFLRRADDPAYDPGARKVERIAAAIGLEWVLKEKSK